MSENKRIDYIALFRGSWIILMVMGHINFGAHLTTSYTPFICRCSFLCPDFSSETTYF